VDFLDEIALTGLRVFGRHGVYEHERADGQHFIVDATLYLSTAAAAASDDVADTVHYGEAAERIAAIVEGEPVSLLETLAQRIADVLLAYEGVRMVAVTVHKPQAPIAREFADVSVSIRRSADAAEFSRPIQVNSRAGSAVTAGSIRGAQLAVGKAGRAQGIYLTDKARAVVPEAARVSAEINRRALAELSRTEQAHLLDAFEELISDLKRA
jgi:dihydroneopterin aldolase